MEIGLAMCGVHSSGKPLALRAAFRRVKGSVWLNVESSFLSNTMPWLVTTWSQRKRNRLVS
eukprot:242289-Rhodomonas_salina.1